MGMSMGSHVFLVLLLSVGALKLASALEFELGPQNAQFCLGHEFYSGQRFRGRYSVPDQDEQWDTAISIMSPGRAIVWSRNDIDNKPGDFDMQAQEDGVYKVCFTAAASPLVHNRFRNNRPRGRPGEAAFGQGLGVTSRRAELSVEAVPDVDEAHARRQQEYERAARNYQNVNKNDVIAQSDLQPINLLLIRLDSQVDRLTSEFREFRERESEHRNTNESTNQRTVSFSLLTIVALCILALYQGYYLRTYFKKKKLI